ncbi:MAG: glycosyltransferase [Candidatus Bathyarchaeia archaeon]
MVKDDFSVLMLSWEFPPRIVGGISSHVNDLSLALAKKGISVHVVTCDFPGAPEYEEIQGVCVYRFDSYKIPAYSFLSWVLSMNQKMIQRAMEVIDAHYGKVDLIHAHDWLVADAAIRLKDFYGKPLVSTMHSTEAGRRGGIRNDYQMTINEVERRLVNESSKVICCSNYMANQISETFNFPREKISVIRNGVNVSKFSIKIDAQAVKRRYAEPNEKMVVYVGRLVHEKGVHVLIGAVPKVLDVLPNVKFVIVGEGGMKEYLLKEAWDFGVSDHVFFTGFVDESMLVSLYKASDVAVFPSLYEPFGITALEAMAAKVPVVVSDTGGLSEIVEHDKTGVKVYPDNSDSVAWGILKVLKDQAFANKIRENAYQNVVENYNWDKIAEETIKVYREGVTLAQPRIVAKYRVEFPSFKFDSYPDEFRVLLSLYTLGAIDSEHARSAEELSSILRIKVNKILRLLQKLISSGYIETSIDHLKRLRYHLTKSGIIKACSLFS